MKLSAFSNYPTKIKKSTSGQVQIYDPIRKKYYVLTPEEWVRQHVIQWLMLDLGVKEVSIAVEKEITFKGLKKRFDVLVFKSAQPYILIECKAPHIALNENVTYQIGRYNELYEAKFVIVTNGEEMYVFEKQLDNLGYRQIKKKEIKANLFE